MAVKKNHVYFLKIIILIKIVFVLVVFLLHEGSVEVGDKALNAQDSEASNPEEKPNQQVKEPKSNENAEKPLDEEKKGRVSFLDSLLDLPALKPEEIQREELGQYLDMAERKEKQIEGRVEILKEKEQQLIQLEKDIDSKLKRLDDERLFLSQTLQKEKEIEEDRLRTLVEFYKKMEPKIAGPIFEQLDKDLVVSLFLKIEEKQVRAILESMNPGKSREITEYFGRIKSGNEYDLLKEVNKSLLDEFQECKGLPKETIAKN